jgi:Protein of unknown function (DUF3592)
MTWLGLLIIVVPMLVVPGFMFWRISVAQKLLAESAGWPGVPATIIESRYGTTAPACDWAVVGYRYTLDGHGYEARRVALTGMTKDRPKAVALLARYPLGAEVTAYVRPGQPGYAVLERTADTSTLRLVALAMGGMFFVVLIIVLLSKGA